jgi:hypothetical protein
MAHTPLIVIVILSCLFAHSLAFTTVRNAASLTAGEVDVFNIGSIQPRLPGSVKITITAQSDIQLCIQEYAALRGSLTSCNKGGYFLFGSNNTVTNQARTKAAGFDTDVDMSALLEEERMDTTLTANAAGNTWVTYTTFRTGSTYFASVAFSSSSDTGNYSISIIYASPSQACASGSIGLPTGACVLAPKAKRGTAAKNSLPSHSLLVGAFTLQKNILTNRFYVSITFTGTKNFDELSDAVSLPNNTVSVALRRGNAPNHFQPDQNDALAYNVMGTNTIVLSIDDPFPGNWYFSVYNHLNNTLNFDSLVYNTSCAMGTAGPLCNSTVLDLTGVQNATYMMGIGDYQYFTLKNASDIIVGVATEKLVDIAPIVLASFLNWPTNDSYLLGSSGNTTNYIFASSGVANTTWNVAVWAYSGQEYYIWANGNCPNNCMGDYTAGSNSTNGVCDAYSGVCQCNSRYGNLTCTRTGLAVVWIVLIVIACAIILAIAVGVPVACYLRNRNRSRYERV